MADRHRNERQRAVHAWVGETFGAAALSKRERLLRLLEETIELVQAEGLDANAARSVVDHVFSKPPGDPFQEAGGVGLTLLAYCAIAGFYADNAEIAELQRVLALDPEHFRARHNRKAEAGIAVRAEVEEAVG